MPRRTQSMLSILRNAGTAKVDYNKNGVKVPKDHPAFLSFAKANVDVSHRRKLANANQLTFGL